MAISKLKCKECVWVCGSYLTKAIRKGYRACLRLVLSHYTLVAHRQARELDSSDFALGAAATYLFTLAQIVGGKGSRVHTFVDVFEREQAAQSLAVPCLSIVCGLSHGLRTKRHL